MARAFQTPGRAPLTRGGATVAALAAVALLIWFVRGALLLIFAGALFGIALRAAADALRRISRLPVTVCVWISVIVVIAVAVSASALGGGAVAAQWAQLQSTFHDALTAAIRALRGVPAVAAILGAFDPSSLAGSAGVFLLRAGGIVSGALGIAVAALVIVFVAVAGALEPSLYRNGFIALFPPLQRQRLSLVIDETVRTLQTWIVARLLSMCITGLLVWFGLTMLRVPLAGALGMLAGALAFIPNVGAIAAAAPSVIIALAISPRLAVLVIVMYWAVHVLDDFLVSPFIERRMVRLPPILTLFAQIVMAVSSGTLGIMLAAPLVATSIVLVRRLWIDDMERAAQNGGIRVQ